MKGKYFLDEIDGQFFSTNSYELFILYLKLFRYSEYKEIMYSKEKTKSNGVPDPYFPADHNSFFKAISQEKKVLESGFIPKRVSVTDIKGTESKRVQWVYNPKRANSFLNESKTLKKYRGI